MSKKYYVVSESELKELIFQSIDRGHFGPSGNLNGNGKAIAAEAACRARPFEKYQAVVEAAKHAVDRPYSMQMAMLADTLAALKKEDI
jgi:hypothetical protein